MNGLRDRGSSGVWYHGPGGCHDKVCEEGCRFSLWQFKNTVLKNDSLNRMTDTTVVDAVRETGETRVEREKM